MRNMTDITIVLDRSGSMFSCHKGVVDGFNAFVEDQRKTPGDGRWTLIQFDSERTYKPFSGKCLDEMKYEVIFNGLYEKEVPLLTMDKFVPRGGTPLRQAICRAIDETGQRLALLPETERPDKVMLLIMTDGEENTSAEEFTDALVKSKIEHQEKVYNWRIQIVGANQDTFKTGQRYGIRKSMCMNFESTDQGSAYAYNCISNNTRNWKLDGNVDKGAESLMGSAAPDNGSQLVGSQPGMNP